jgi:hypothetical protein
MASALLHPLALPKRALRAARRVLSRKKLVELLQTYLERLPPCCM